MKKFAKICCIGCFLGILFVSAILTITSEKETISYYENRMLAAFPEYTKESLLSGEYPAEISSYCPAVSLALCLWAALPLISCLRMIKALP